MIVSLLKNLLRSARHPQHESAPWRADRPIRLHVGGQIAHPDWKILDVQAGPHVDFVGHCTDLSRFDDASVSEIYASHVIEHLKFVTELPTALREFCRVLTPGGMLRASVPDLTVLCTLFLDPDLDTKQRFHVMRMMFGAQSDEADFHYVGLNEEMLRLFLEQAGFVEIVRVSGFGLFDDTSNLVYKLPISLNMTARKPR